MYYGPHSYGLHSHGASLGGLVEVTHPIGSETRPCFFDGRPMREVYGDAPTLHSINTYLVPILTRAKAMQRALEREAEAERARQGRGNSRHASSM